MTKTKRKIYLALLHYPVTNKTGDTVTTAITNMDLHDIARTGRTYGVEKFYVVNPLDSQIMLAERILNYWSKSTGSRIIPDRKEALDIVRVVDTLEKAIQQITQDNSQRPIIVATDARESGSRVTYNKLKNEMHQSDCPYLLLFGTGYGLLPKVLEESDYILDPIRGMDHYNHLSVRSAVAIILDRLVGVRENISSSNTEIYQKEENYASSY